MGGHEAGVKLLFTLEGALLHLPEVGDGLSYRLVRGIRFQKAVYGCWPVMHPAGGG